jgi:hypothetical protein
MSLFNWAWKLQKHDASLLQRGTGIVQHERRRVSRFMRTAIHSRADTAPLFFMLQLVCKRHYPWVMNTPAIL